MGSYSACRLKTDRPAGLRRGPRRASGREAVAFIVETGEDDGLALGASMRFAHAQAYVRDRHEHGSIRSIPLPIAPSVRLPDFSQTAEGPEFDASAKVVGRAAAVR